MLEISHNKKELEGALYDLSIEFDRECFIQTLAEILNEAIKVFFDKNRDE